MSIQQKSDQNQNLSANCCIETICREYTKLTNRLKGLQPRRRRRRINFLALPKHVTLKSIEINTEQPSRKTEIVHDTCCSTRIEQLSYPFLRKLLSVQNDFKDVLGTRRLYVLNRTIRKSILSLYSRLANVQPPEEMESVSVWTKKDWAKHRKYLRNLSRPRKIFKPPKAIHMYKDIKLLKRFRHLCRPKTHLVVEMPQWKLSKALRNYRPTNRIKSLSEPRTTRDDKHFQSPQWTVSPGALKYKASKRIQELATAPEVRLGESDLKENPYGVSANALKAKASERILELANPREYEEGHIRQNPFTISPAALKAKITPRLIELAKPRGTA